MDWELIHKVMSVLGGIGTIVGLYQVYINSGVPSSEIAKLGKFRYFILASSSWALLILVSHWLFDPFGPIVTRDEEKQIFAIAIAFPIVVCFVYSLNRMLRSNAT